MYKTLLWCCGWHCKFHIGQAAKAYFLWRPTISNRCVLPIWAYCFFAVLVDGAVVVAQGPSTLTVFPKHENNRFRILSIYAFGGRFWDKQEVSNHMIAITFHSSVLLWSFKWKLRGKTLLWCCWWYCEYHIGETAKAYFLWRPTILNRADTIGRGPGIFPGYFPGKGKESKTRRTP